MGQQNLGKPLRTLKDKAITTWGHDDELAAVQTIGQLVQVLNRLVATIKGSNLHKLSYRTLRDIKVYAEHLYGD